jgi:replicative DNA helicase
VTERFDPRAEREAVAAALRGHAFEVFQYCRPIEFHDSSRRHIMHSIEEMLQNGVPVTRATLCDRLRLRGELTVEAEDEIQHASDYLDYQFDAEAAARIVRDMAGQREVRQIVETAGREIDSGRTTTERAVAFLMNRLMGISVSGSQRSRSVADVVPDVDRHIDRLFDGSVIALSTGIPAVDQAIGGLQLSEVFGLTGPPGSAKSLVKNKMGLMAAASGYPTVSYILEMTSVQEMIRSTIIWAGGQLSAKPFRGGPGMEPPTVEQVEMFRAIEAEIAKFPLWLDNTKFSLMEILADAERRVGENGVKLILIDYAQLISAGDGTNRTAELERISQASRVFAQKNECAVGIVVRLDKAGALNALKGQELTGAELHGSSSFHYDLSSLVSLYFDKAMWLCKCPFLDQHEWDKTRETYVSLHTPGMKKFCQSCGSWVRATDRRLGNAFVLKARDGDTFTKIPLKLEGSTLQISEFQDSDVATDPSPIQSVGELWQEIDD